MYGRRPVATKTTSYVSSFASPPLEGSVVNGEHYFAPMDWGQTSITYRKDLVEREKVGRSYVYRPLVTRENIISRLMHDIAESLTDGDATPMVSGFLDYLGDRGEEYPRISEMRADES